VEETVVGVRGGYVTGSVLLYFSQYFFVVFDVTNSWRWHLDPSAVTRFVVLTSS